MKALSIPFHWRGAGRIKHILSVEEIIQFSLAGVRSGFDVHPHAVTVQIAAALPKVVAAQLYPVLGGIYIAEIAKSLAVEILKPLIVQGIGPPVSDIAAKGEEDDISGAD